jgi:hypothetical protein
MIPPTNLHRSPDCATRAGLFVFDVKFTHHDKQVKSERILRNAARPKPFVSTVFEDASSLGLRALHFIAREGGRSIYITYSVKRGYPFRFFPP